jgi:phosphoglycerate dehydrogenase-like enzyme
MHPIGCDKHLSPQYVSALSAKGIELTNFDNVVSRADFLSLHVPLNESTYHLINAATLSRMKPGAFLINIARGGVVDEEALYNELIKGGRLCGAALDVHKEEGEGRISPLAGLPNVVLTPHIGAMTIDSQREIGRRVVEIIDSFASS